MLVFTICILFSGAQVFAEELYEGQAQLIRDGYLNERIATERIVARGESFESYMLSQFEARATKIDVSAYKLTSEQFRASYTNLIDGHPELFYVPSRWKQSLTSDGFIYSIHIEYLYSEEETAQKMIAYNAAVDRIITQTAQASTQLGKMMIAHDYLCVHFEYDTDLEIYSAEEMFRLGKGVCQAYLQCFQAVMNELNISCVPVISETMNHGWNAVKMDGSWYHVDTTWDDPISTTDIPLRACHDHFLLSDEGMNAAGHQNWSAGVTADNTQYDEWFWKNLKTAIPVTGETMYYVDPTTAGGTRTVKAWNMRTNTTSQVIVYSIHNVKGKGYLVEGYYPICTSDTHLYYMKNDRVYSVPLSGGTSALVYAVPDDVCIWNAYSDGETIQLYADTKPGNGAGILSFSGNRASLTALPNVMHLSAEETQAFTACVIPGMNAAYSCSWSSSNPSSATVDADGKVTGIAAGISVVKAVYSGELSASRAVIVHGDQQILIPNGTFEIADEAFCGTDAKEVILPDSVTTIGSRAFADCSELFYVNLPANLSQIADDAFENSTGVTLLCKQGTYAASFAASSGLSYIAEP